MEFAGPFDPACRVGQEPRTRGERDSQGRSRSKTPKYCLVIVDKLSRYPVLVPVADTTAKTTITALQSHLYPVFGVSEMVIMDQDGSFTSREMQAHYEEVGLRWI